MINLINGDCLEEMKKIRDGSIDLVLTDPPYELGFMGKSWDSSGIAFDTEMWADIYKLLKPGGHLLAFSGSRTYHRMAVAIEDAGFEIRDMIEWVYGSGFPKSLNIGKAVDKLQGNKREIVRERSGAMNNAKNSEAQSFTKGDVGFKTHFTETKGTSEWEGWGTALKPAHEPCVLARKPLDGTVANNVLKHGTGGLNIDGSRVGYTSESDMESAKWGGAGKPPSEASWKMQSKIVYDTRTPLGRFPANLIHDGSDEVEAVFPQTGKGNGGKPFSYSGREYDNKDSSMFNGGKPQAPSNFNDSGSASRFFYTAKSSRSERNLGLDGTVSIVVQLEQCENNITSSVKLAQLQVVMDSSHLKATAESGIGTKSGTEWSMSLFGNQYTEKYLISTKSTTKTTTSSITPSTILNYLTGLLTNENTLGANCEMTVGGSPAENVENSNTLTLTINEKTASALGVENVQLPAQLKISVSDGKNFHSTVKPLSLTKYLATLIKPPTGGRLLVPFSGSGSEMIGALQAGWEYVEGVELTEEYIPIAKARIEYWTNKIEDETKQMELV